MYRNDPYRQDGEFGGLALTGAMLLLFVIYIVSVLATHLLLHFLVNPYLLDGKLDEDDNLILMVSAGLWTLIAGVIAPPMFAIGTAWGLLVGLGIVIWSWWGVDTATFEPVPGFAEVTGLSGEFYLPSQEVDQAERDLSLSELEALILGQQPEGAEPTEFEPYPASNNGRQPEPVAAPPI